ncbi:MAG: hypothetical protein KGK02_11170 [Rhodospirillales bacterium]|nr:hypothetical protein [Rhodospirillales bacterium]
MAKKPQDATARRQRIMRRRYVNARRWFNGQILRLDATWATAPDTAPEAIRAAALDRLEAALKSFFDQVPADILDRRDDD